MNVPLSDWKATRYQKRLVRRVMKSGRLTYGPMTEELERRFAEIHGRKHALFLSSGTSALKIVLHAFKDYYGWEDGDEVIIPATTFIATMNAVIMAGLKPVLVDVSIKTINIDPTLINKTITPRTRAILPVHLLGQSADMMAILDIAKKHNLKVIEDSCETAFTIDSGFPVGSRGDAACYSTYMAHHLVTGVGGFITTNNTELATIMRSMMFHGRDESYLTIDDNFKTGDEFDHMIKNRFHFNRFGYSDRATELQAALGLGGLKTYEKDMKKRRANALALWDGIYCEPIVVPVEDVQSHGFMFFPMLVSDRDELMKHLEKNGIQTRTMMPLTIQPIVKRYLNGRTRKFKVAKTINEQGLLIGCHQHLSKKHIQYVVKIIREFYR